MPKAVANVSRNQAVPTTAGTKTSVAPTTASFGGHTVKAARPPSNAGQVRDLISAAICGDGGSAFITPKDSRVVVAKKIIGTAHNAINLHNFHARLAIGRAARITKEISSVAQNTDWYNKNSFDIGTRPFTAIHGVVSTAAFLKRGYDMAYDVAADVSRHKDRQELRALVKAYDPATGGFLRANGSGSVFYNDYSMRRIKEIATKENTWKRTIDGGNPWRTNRQRAMDLISRGRDNSTSLLSGGVPNLIAMAVPLGTSTLLTAATGLSVVGHAVAATNNFIKAGTACIAINNAEAARVQAKNVIKQYKIDPANVKMVATNQLLVGIADRVIQERTYAARLNFWHGFSFAASSVVNALGMAGTGVTGVSLAASQIVSFALLFASGIATTGFGIVHNRTLAKRRDTATRQYNINKDLIAKFDEDTKMRYFKSLNKPEQIGMLERHMIDTLRGKSRADAQAAYDFLHACGISNSTIKSLMLNPNSEAALTTMQKHLYTERTQFFAKNTKYTAKTMGYVSGVSYLNRYIKTKKEERAQKHDLNSMPTLPQVKKPEPIAKARQQVGHVLFELEGNDAVDETCTGAPTRMPSPFAPAARANFRDSVLPPEVLAAKLRDRNWSMYSTHPRLLTVVKPSV